MFFSLSPSKKQPNGIDGTPGDEPVPDSGVRTSIRENDLFTLRGIFCVDFEWAWTVGSRGGLFQCTCRCHVCLIRDILTYYMIDSSLYLQTKRNYTLTISPTLI